MRQCKLRSEHCGPVGRLCGSPQRTARRSLDAAIADSYQRPQRKQNRPNAIVATRAQDDRHNEQQNREQASRGNHHATIRQAVEHTRQLQRRKHRTGAEAGKRYRNIAIGTPQQRTHQDDGADDDHGAGGRHR